MKKIDEPGETIEDIVFSEEPVMVETHEQDGHGVTDQTGAEQTNSEPEDQNKASLGDEQTVVHVDAAFRQ